MVSDIERLELLVSSSEAKIKAAQNEMEREHVRTEYQARASQLRCARRETRSHCEGSSACHNIRVTKCENGHPTCMAHANRCEMCNPRH
jgi:hypothetical protein